MQVTKEGSALTTAQNSAGLAPSSSARSAEVVATSSSVSDDSVLSCGRKGLKLPTTCASTHYVQRLMKLIRREPERRQLNAQARHAVLSNISIFIGCRM